MGQKLPNDTGLILLDRIAAVPLQPRDSATSIEPVVGAVLGILLSVLRAALVPYPESWGRSRLWLAVCWVITLHDAPG